MFQVEDELKSICSDILDVLDKHLIPSSGSGESKVFYYKMYVGGGGLLISTSNSSFLGGQG